MGLVCSILVSIKALVLYISEWQNEPEIEFSLRMLPCADLETSPGLFKPSVKSKINVGSDRKNGKGDTFEECICLAVSLYLASYEVEVQLQSSYLNPSEGIFQGTTWRYFMCPLQSEDVMEKTRV